MKTSHLLYGTAYYPEYLPYTSLPDNSISRRIQTDMQMMKKAGINVIRIAESSWSTFEPFDNKFAFTIIHQIIQCAEDAGIEVIVGTPTNTIPPWLAKKHPDILGITREGSCQYGCRHNIDITNPNYLFYAERIIRRLMEEISSYSNIIGFQLDSETKAYGAYSEHAQNLFITYLKEKFHTTERMNEAFGLTYWSNCVNDWNDFPDIRGTMNGSLGAEYECFQRKLITDFLAWQAGIVQEYTKKEQFLTHNFDFEWRGYSFGIQPEVNQMNAAKSLTIPGLSIYHPSRSELTGAEISFCGTVGRAIAKATNQSQYLVLETQAQGIPQWLPYDHQLRLQAYAHIANGAKSVLYWHWHSTHNATNSYLKGVLSHDLNENKTYQDVSTIGHELEQIGETIQIVKKTLKIAMIIDSASLVGMEWFPINESFGYNDVVRWIYDTLHRLNLECDMIPVTYEHFEEYNLIIAPCLYSTSYGITRKLVSYVKQGGHLLTTFKTAFTNDNLQVHCGKQPYGLTECCGMTYDQFTIPENASMLLELPDDILSTEVPISQWMELLRPTTAQIWAMYQDPHYQEYAAVTHNHFGKGSCTYIGCYFQSSFLELILQELCVEAEIKQYECHFPVIRKSGLNRDGQRIIYYFNFSDTVQSVSCTVKNAKIILQNDQITYNDVVPGQLYSLEPWNLMIVQKLLS